MQQPQSPRSYDDFIIRAYQGAYGRSPTCTERQNEYNNLVNAAASGTLLHESQRFVAPLFETQASFDANDYTTYLQTPEYNARNSQDDPSRLQDFVTDLYHAFLQREPDADGLNFWVANAQQEGRKKVIIAFEVSIEFGDLVNQLFDGGAPPCCIRRTCPRYTFWDPDTCSCQPL